MLPEFDLLMPQSLPEALDMLAEGGSEAEGGSDIVPIAGGTNVIVEMRDKRLRGKTLMDVSRLSELRCIRWENGENGRVVLGGGTTISELLKHPVIAEHGVPLRQAAAVLGSPLVRNRATVAGNLVDASPAADTAPPLLVLGAEVELAGQKETRFVPLNEFFVGPNETVRRPDELLVSVRWPVPSTGCVGAFHKIGLRNALACSVVTAAVAVERDERGRCQDARIALGAVAPTPIRAFAAEDALGGRLVTDEDIVEAARLSTEASQPIDDVRATAEYRRRMVEVLVRRLLAETLKVSENL